MMRSVAVVVLSLLLLPVALRAEPPRVIDTVPVDGDFDVDPLLSEIRITFDQDMSPGGRSLCGGGDWMPALAGEPYWETPRIFVMPVALEVNHDYGFNINCPSARNFRGENGESSLDYSLQFATAGGESEVAPELHEASAKELRRLVEERYSYRDRVVEDWGALFGEYEEALRGADTPEQFGRYAGRLLAAAEDVHISVRLGERYFASFRRYAPINGNFRKLPERVPNWEQSNNIVFSGRYPDDIGYLLIAAWDGNNPAKLQPALKALRGFADCSGVIIDVRANSGGSETLAREIAGCFVEEPIVYAQHVTRDPSEPTGFGAPYQRVLQPNEKQPHYAGKVVVLTGQHVMSSCEAFLLMMQTVPDCVLIGEASYGSSGNPQRYELPNGVTVSLPSWKAMTAAGDEFEGIGIAPDIEIKTTWEDFAESDPILEAALEHLRTKAAEDRRTD
jgi:Peptidase family S41